MPARARRLSMTATVLATLVLAVHPEVALSAPPANDAFSDAMPITSLPFGDSVDMTQATVEPLEPFFNFCGPANEKTVWYRFSPTSPAVIRAITSSPTFVPLALGLYRSVGSGFAGLIPVSCAREARQLDFRVQAGETYYLQAGLLVNGSATIRTTVERLDLNDDFAEAAPVTALPFTDSRNTRVATPAADDPSCAGRIGKTIWYAFTPQADGRIDADTFDSNYETTLSVYTGARGALTQVACNERSQGFQSRVVFTAVAGRTYYFMVGGAGGDAVVHIAQLPQRPPSPTSGTFLFLAGEPGDWVGGTTVRTLTPANSTFRTRTARGTSEVHVDVRPFAGLPEAGIFWFVDLAAPDGRPLVPGTYENAVRWPFQPPGVPGLSVSGDGRGCNTVTGRFVVNEARYASDGAIVTFDADFEQHCEGGPPALFGKIRIEAPDTTPPVLTIPSSATVDATAPTGATVEFAASGRDDVDGDVTVACSPASGSVFPIGTTTVTCTATDASGNIATASFEVRVKGAAEQLAELATAVTGVGPGTSFADKVSNARAALAAGNPRGACEILVALGNQLTAQKGKSITEQQAVELLATVTRIRAVLAC